MSSRCHADPIPPPPPGEGQGGGTCRGRTRGRLPPLQPSPAGGGRRFALLALLLLVLALPAGAAERSLRVCADPNNLPFSNRSGEGFENKLAELLAADRGAALEYTWWAQRRGFVRNTLRAGECDVMMGAPMGYELALTTKPYYRSAYVFVVRR